VSEGGQAGHDLWWSAADDLGRMLGDQPVRGVDTPPSGAAQTPGDQELTAQALARSVLGQRYGLAEDYVALLADQGLSWGLIGPRELPRLWSRHLVNSLSVVPLIAEQSVVADVGSGAGLPGIPLALARPDLQIHLVEPMQRRCDFLTLAIDRLGLADQVSLWRGRVEDFTYSVDYVTCRALASMRQLIEWVSPSLVPPAQLLAIKGDRASLELADAGKQLKKRHLSAEIISPELAGQMIGTVVRVWG
jgi:16S rRNA (guanine527-N7)-methyltransferase